MAITAALVKELRERTGAGMMECKKALVETDGDIEAAIELMRKSGQAKAAKKAGRTAADGVIVVQTSADGSRAVMVEVNCETDFVAKDENFASFAEAVAERALEGGASDVEALMAQPLHEGEDTTIEEARQALISKIGENMNVRRFVRMESSGTIASYLHGVRIGVLVDLEGGDAELGRDLAMHIAASNPLCIDEDQVSPELLAKEREIAEAQAQESGKPADIVNKMVEGRIR
jgi:elongation factor Ts